MYQKGQLLLMNKRRLRIFLIAGIMTVIVDFAVYILMLALDISVGLSKATGFIFGTIFAYFINRFWTFGDVNTKQSSFMRFILIYTTSLGLNITVNKSVLSFLNLFIDYKIVVAFLLATFCSATLNYFGMKHFVFTPRRN